MLKGADGEAFGCQRSCELAAEPGEEFGSARDEARDGEPRARAGLDSFLSSQRTAASLYDLLISLFSATPDGHLTLSMPSMKRGVDEGSNDCAGPKGSRGILGLKSRPLFSRGRPAMLSLVVLVVAAAACLLAGMLFSRLLGHPRRSRQENADQPWERIERLAAAGGGQAPSKLISYLENEDPYVRARACEALGKQPDCSRVIAALVGVLQEDRDKRVRTAAAYALLPRKRDPRVKAALIDALEDYPWLTMDLFASGDPRTAWALGRSLSCLDDEFEVERAYDNLKIMLVRSAAEIPISDLRHLAQLPDTPRHYEREWMNGHPVVKFEGISLKDIRALAAQEVRRREACRPRERRDPRRCLWEKDE